MYFGDMYLLSLQWTYKQNKKFILKYVITMMTQLGQVNSMSISASVNNCIA